MHVHTTDDQKHSHVFLGERHEHYERKTRIVIAVTATMMVAEIIGGTLLGSMALVADGWHMSTHAGALAISAFAYMYARQHKHDPDFAFGTGKLGDLAGFTSAIVLAMVSIFIVYQALQRLITPVPIIFGEAIAVATIGLVVNVVSALLLHDGNHAHDHHDDHAHKNIPSNHHHHRDNNIRSAYIHIIADAAISVMAIVGLLCGWIYGWIWMDPIMGVIGALVIANWAYTLMRDTGRVLLDITPDKHLEDSIRSRLESNGDTVTDLHLWQVGPGHYGAIVSLVADNPQSPDIYKKILAGLKALSHVTVEVHPCKAVDPKALSL